MTTADLNTSLHTQYISQTIEFPEHDGPVHQRWTDILTHFSDVRGRTLDADFSALYADALAYGDRQTVLQALSLVRLQIRYYSEMVGTGRIFPHVFDFENTANFVWQMRLINRYVNIRPAQRARGKIIPEEARPAPTLQWRH